MSYPSQSRDVDVREGYFEPETTVDEDQYARLAALLGCVNEPVVMQNAVAKLLSDGARLRLEVIETEKRHVLTVETISQQCLDLKSEVARFKAALQGIAKDGNEGSFAYDVAKLALGGTDVQS